MGPETTEWQVPLSDILVDDAIVEAVRGVAASGWWSAGPLVEEFEAAFALWCGSRHAIAVANGTAALHLALVATGCGAGDEVIVPSLNFVAAANAIVHTGATPVFCDIAADDDLNLDPADVRAAITPSTKAIVVLHYGGYPCRIDEVLELASELGVAVIEDAAHAPGAALNGRTCGTIGRLGCFSFFANKNLPVGEGGMVVTDDDELAQRLRLLRSHGMTTLTWDRHRGHADSYDVLLAGFNYRLDEIRAAIGLVELSRVDAANRARGRIVDLYRGGLEGFGGATMPFADVPHGTRSAYHLAVILLPDASLPPTVRTRLAGAGIQTSVHYPPIHRFTHYASTLSRPLPRTEEVAGRLVTLPLYAHMEDTQVELVLSAVRSALETPAVAPGGQLR